MPDVEKPSYLKKSKFCEKVIHKYNHTNDNSCQYSIILELLPLILLIIMMILSKDALRNMYMSYPFVSTVGVFDLYVSTIYFLCSIKSVSLFICFT